MAKPKAARPSATRAPTRRSRTKSSPPVKQCEPDPPGPLDPPAARSARVAAWLDRVEKNGYVRLVTIGVATLAFIGVVATLAAIYLEIDARKDERANWRLDRIERAWSRILLPVTGNTGKGGALAYLISQEEGLNGVDLSCGAMGGVENGDCVRPVYFSEMELERPTKEDGFEAAEIAVLLSEGEPKSLVEELNEQLPDWSIDLTDGIVLNARFDGVGITDCKCERVIFFNTDLTDATLGALVDSKYGNSTIENGRIAFDGKLQVISVGMRGKIEFSAISAAAQLVMVDSAYEAENPPQCVREGLGGYSVHPCPAEILRENVACIPREIDDPTARNFQDADALRWASDLCDLHWQGMQPISYDEAVRRFPDAYKVAGE